MSDCIEFIKIKKPKIMKKRVNCEELENNE